MSIKSELLKWQEAVDAFEDGKSIRSYMLFEQIKDIGAKIYFNIGMIYSSLDRQEDAIVSFTNAITQDNYLAIAYFQCGVCHWVKGQFQQAIEMFGITIENMRGNKVIDYHQLGLPYKLCSFEVRFNRAICFLALGDVDSAMVDLRDMPDEKILDEHHLEKYKPEVVQLAHNEGRLPEYMPFAVPQGLMYRPPSAKVENVDDRNYLGKGEVIAALDQSDTFVGFQAPVIREALHGEEAEAKESTMSGDILPEADIVEVEPEPAERRESTNSAESSGQQPSLAESPQSERLSLAMEPVAEDTLNVKCFKGDDIRAILLPDRSYDTLIENVKERYELEDVTLQYVDEDGERVLMCDQEDLNFAIQSLSLEDKLEVYLD